MKTLISKPVLFYGLILLIATGLTLFSLRFVRPATCQTFCDAPEQSSCPPGACRYGEQRAGLPIPIRIDVSPGSSPTSGWAKLGPEDGPNPLTFLLDVLFYGAFIWLIVYLIRLIEGKEKLFDTFAFVLPLAVVVIFLLVGLYLYLPFYNR